MAERPSVTILSTSDRYGLEFEQRALARVTDLDVTLRHDRCPDESTLVAQAADADALLITTRHKISRGALARLPRLRVIASYGVGLDHIDLDAAAEHGVVVTHVPDYCTNEVADHALALILALNRRIVELDRNLRNGAWLRHDAHTTRMMRGPIAPLREQVLGIVGLGRIGRKVAERARPFGLTVLAADPYLDAGVAADLGAELVPLDDLLARSDIVTIHCPLTPETRGLINAETLGRMKESAVLVNTARGPIVDLPAITDALQRGTIAAAALDVFVPEPLPEESPLYQMENVILTPHAAYYSERSVETVRAQTLESALALFRGERPRTVANPAVFDRISVAPAG